MEPSQGLPAGDRAWLLFGTGVAVGVAGFALLDGLGSAIGGGPPIDPRESGLPWPWLAFGFAAQALFMARMLVQWITTERHRRSVVPVAFWWLSLLGGFMLLAYFLRRGDPVGVVGQAFGVAVYLRNLVHIRRERAAHWLAVGTSIDIR
jgi:lipid-A-disaccharide synthase-like uncharacterized protein